MDLRRPTGRQLWVTCAFVLGLPLVAWLTGRGWLVPILDAASGSERAGFALGLLLSAGWYVIPLVGMLATRRRDPRPPWLFWLFLALVCVALTVVPTRRESSYNEALDARVPGFTAGQLAGAIPLVVGGAAMYLAPGFGRLHRRWARRGGPRTRS